MFSWNLFPHLVGSRPQLAGTVSAVDHFVGWNGLRWGSEPTKDMILDFDDDSGTTCYWRGEDLKNLAKRGLKLCEFDVSSILYSYMNKELCSVGFAIPTDRAFGQVYENLCTAYGTPTDEKDDSQNYSWDGQRNAVRLRKREKAGGTLAWFNLPRL